MGAVVVRQSNRFTKPVSLDRSSERGYTSHEGETNGNEDSHRGSAVLAVAAAATLTAAGLSYRVDNDHSREHAGPATSSDLRIITTTPGTPCAVRMCPHRDDPGCTRQRQPVHWRDRYQHQQRESVELHAQRAACDGRCQRDLEAEGRQRWRITQGSLIIPAGGAVVTVPSSGCSITVGASTIGPLPYAKPSVTASNSGTVNFNSTGGGVCPPAGPGTAALTGKLTFSPGIDVTP
ncbi:hypothetical protein GS943_09290 [Rhodococcus hoagii]|nr:hypothetical protein [Prescottella equi]